MNNRGALRSPIKHLRRDLYAVACDAEALLKATAEVTNDQVQQARARTERTVRQAFDHLYGTPWRKQLGKVVQRADGYVREHSWTVVGAAIMTGLLIGLIARRAS